MNLGDINTGGASAPVREIVRFVDLYRENACYPQVNSNTGLSFLNVTGVTDMGMQGTISLNAPVDEDELKEADDATKAVLRKESYDWVLSTKGKIEGLIKAGKTRIPLENAQWIADRVTNKNGLSCGKIKRMSRAEQLVPRWGKAEAPPRAPSTDNSELDSL